MRSSRRSSSRACSYSPLYSAVSVSPSLTLVMLRWLSIPSRTDRPSGSTLGGWCQLSRRHCSTSAHCSAVRGASVRSTLSPLPPVSMHQPEMVYAPSASSKSKQNPWS